MFDHGLKAAAARGAGGAAAYAHLAIQYAHLLRVAYGDARGARAVYGEALRVHPDQLALWEGAIHLEETLEGPVRQSTLKATQPRTYPAPCARPRARAPAHARAPGRGCARARAARGRALRGRLGQSRCGGSCCVCERA